MCGGQFVAGVAAAKLPLSRLPFQTIVVASENDPAVSLHRARLFAQAWGSEFVNAGVCGHIEEKSGFGPWPGGHLLLERLLGKLLGTTSTNVITP
jgi:predicted alpha/beta hydrolase family esterase